MRARYAGFMVIGAMGFFTLAAQALLFRDVFGVFEGNELGAAAYFGSWLLWIAFGALAGRGGRAQDTLSRHFPLMVLAYVPAFIAQQQLILHARALAGVEAYQLFPFARMLALLGLFNAPVSFLTGFLFTLASRWAARHTRMPVSMVYILETLGSCAGGFTITFCLWIGIESETLSLAAMGALIIFVACFLLTTRRWRFAALALLLAGVAAVLSSGSAGERWRAHNCSQQWVRLLPAESFGGSFTTPQNRYLFGRRDGQLIVMASGGVCDTYPPDEHAAEVAALHLAQKPDAKNVLVFGANGLAICGTLARFPQIRQVDWMHNDPQYPRQLLALMEKDAPAKVAAPGVDLRVLAGAGQRTYDIVMLNLPDVASLAMNRYCTDEFFREAKALLSENGIISVRVTGVANYMGAEVSWLGTSVLCALLGNYKNFVLKPGDESWLIASDGDGLMQDASALAGRFAAIEGAEAIYPSKALLALYPADRVAFQMQGYTATPVLRNTDASPRALFYALLAALKQADWRGLVKLMPVLLKISVFVFAGPSLLYALLRAIYLVRSRKSGAGVTDIVFLIFSTGFAGMAASILLLYLYQGRFGSLFLDVGLLTAWFMAGSFAGGAVFQHVTSTEKPRQFLLVLTLFVEVAALVLLPLLTAAAPRWVLMALFPVCGLFTGCWFPIAAQMMRVAGRTEGVAASLLETFDTLGGAVGAAVTGLLLLPLMGMTGAGWVLALLVAVNLVPTLMHDRVGEGDWYDRWHRAAGYTLAGIALYVLACSHAAATALAADDKVPFQQAARALAGSSDLVEKEDRAPDGKPFQYYCAGDGYIFRSDGWGAKVRAYGGTLSLAIRVDPNGSLMDYKIIRSFETPAYQAMTEARKQRLFGKNIFEPNPFQGIGAVSGATITADAISKLIETAGQGFAKCALNRVTTAAVQEMAAPVSTPALRDFAVLAALSVAAIVMRYRPRRWLRRALLACSIMLCGFWLNQQFSLQQVMTLAQLNIGLPSVSGTFFLLAIVPLLVIVFGNIYCGHLCPFGALQELVGDLLPSRLKWDIGKSAWRYARAIKYILLFLLAVLFGLTRDFSLLQGDPLITFFSGAMGKLTLGIVAAVFTLSLFSNRFWCRNLCPAGAFLSLLNGVRLFRRIQPPRYPAYCDMGVETADDLDCLHCDRCAIARHSRESGNPATPVPWQKNAFALALFLVAAAFCAGTFQQLERILPAMTAPSAGLPGSSGKPRDINTDTFKRLMQERKLSDHPAEFSTPVLMQEAPPESGASTTKN